MATPIQELDRQLARLEDILVTSMVAVITILLGLGVVLRYVFNDPLTWSEEFVVTLFVWSIMLGVPSALRARMHIRIDALILRLRPGARRLVGAVAFTCGGVVLVAAIYAGWAHTVSVWGNQTPMLGYSMGWIFVSLPIGFALTLFHGAVIFFHEGPEAVFRNSTEAIIDTAQT